MKRHRGLPGASSTDLDLSPTDATHTETEHFRDGLLRSPPTGEMQNVRAAIHLLPFGIDAIEEAPRMLLEHVADPPRLDDVDANLRTHKEKNASTAARRVAPASGLCTSRGSPGPALRSERSERRERREGCGEVATTGRSSSISAFVPCFISPAAVPSAWMYESSFSLSAPSRAVG